MQDVFFSHIARCENGDEWRRVGGFFYVGSAVCLFTLHQTHHPNYLESKLASSLDGLHRRSARSADIVDNDYACALLAETLDALSGAMLLFGLAYQEAMQIAADDRNGDNDRVGTEGETTDGFGLPPALADFFEEDLAGKTRTLGIERSGAAVDVIIASGARRELELSQAEGFLRE